MTLVKEINKEIEDFKTKRVTIVPGYTHNQYEVVNRVFHYYNSKYTNRAGVLDPIDEDGDRMYFYNIVKNPCKVFSKAIDFDTKNIRLLTTGSGDTLKTWFMERDLKFWMRKHRFGKTLNRIFRDLPIYGSVVLKIVDGLPYFVDLRNFVVEQGADTLDDTNYIVEIHNYTIGDFKRAAKEMGWDKDKVQEAVEKFRAMQDTSHIRVYERYGELPETAEENVSDYKWKRVFMADVGVNEYDQRGELIAEHPGVLLKEEEWEGHPYREIHAEKIPGRWLGVGVVETLFEPQIRENELANLQTKTSYWSALRLFQSRDATVARNLLREAENGEVLQVDSEITQVDMSDRNLAFFNEETRKWLINRDELSFSYDAIQGERSPAGTPLGSVQISIGQTLSYFEQIQEEIAMEIKDMLYNDIIPSFSKKNGSKHTLRLVGDDLDKFASMVKSTLLLQETARYALNKRRIPTPEEREAIEFAITARIKQGGERVLEVPKGFYKDVVYDVDIDITGESLDTRVRNATVFAILQAMSVDPNIMKDPNRRRLIYRLAEDGGLNLHDYIDEEEQEPQTNQQPSVGGGVSAPNFGALAGTSQQTV